MIDPTHDQFMSGFLLGAGGRSDLFSGGAFANNGGAIAELIPQVQPQHIEVHTERHFLHGPP
jgi:hypothetical protein